MSNSCHPCCPKGCHFCGHNGCPYHYEDFSQFSSAISGCLDEAHLKHNQELDSLLSLRFQTFDKTQIMNL